MCVFFLLSPTSERHMLFVTGFHEATKKHSDAQPRGLSDLGHVTEPSAPSSLHFLEARGLGCPVGSAVGRVQGPRFGREELMAGKRPPPAPPGRASKLQTHGLVAERRDRSHVLPGESCVSRPNALFLVKETGAPHARISGPLPQLGWGPLPQCACLQHFWC